MLTLPESGGKDIPAKYLLRTDANSPALRGKSYLYYLPASMPRSVDRVYKKKSR